VCLECCVAHPRLHPERLRSNDEVNMRRKIVAFVLAGGRGNRLLPLTRERSKPAVPFGGKYRMVDFVLSNLINSGIFSIYVMVQYRSQSLLKHLRDGWQFRKAILDEGVTIPDGEHIGYNPEHDRNRYHVTDSGIVVVVSTQAVSP
jgi:ADP-glucose pyrophosphorylase